MVITGDVAVAPGDSFRFVGFDDLLMSKPWCVNLEGSILGDTVQMPKWGVYNSERWRESFRGFRLGPAFVANNHMNDLFNGVESSLERLLADGMSGFGAGRNTVEAGREVAVTSGSRDYCLLGFGWTVIGCRAAGAHKPGVNPLEGARVLASARRMVERFPAKRVVVVIHGNYEFELYPQPAHRRLAKQLVDLGVYAVICHHPHVVGPVERYRGRTIAYSVGNWAFSYGRFFDGRLKFPPSSLHQIAVELGDDGDVVHHASFEPPTTIRFDRSEKVEGESFTLRPAFEGFDDDAYLDWFKSNRKKRRGLPIYRDPDDSIGNFLRDRWVGLRQQLLDVATKSGFKSLRRNA